MQSFSLYAHPQTPGAAVQQIKASLGVESGILTVSYGLNGVLDSLRIPDQAQPATDDLWQHTCFELFLGATNDAEYYEFNFSPSGLWALYAFRNYRDGMRIQVEGFDPKISVQRDGDDLQLNAVVPLSYLSGIQNGMQLSLGIAAVVEDRSGVLSYWALKHPPGEPDFHRPDNFAVQVDLPMIDRDGIDDTAKP
jgi:hypothetical protein